MTAEVREHLRVPRAQELDAAASEHGRRAPRRQEAPHRVEERRGLAHLRRDVHGLVAVDRIGDDRQVELSVLDAREAGVPVPRPLHRRAHAVAVAQVDVVAHADLVAVVDDGAARQGQQQAVQELHASPIAVQERRQPPADAEIQLHVGLVRVGVVHEGALFVGDHLERQLVVISQK